MADNDNDLMPRPRQRQRAPFDLAFGDSIAVQQYNHGVTGRADAQFRHPDQPITAGATGGVGDPPSRVLARLQQTLAADPTFFKGKRLFLSPGTSNDPTQLSNVKEIFDTLKGLGDNAPASVVVPGVGPGVHGNQQGAVNAALEPMVHDAGFKYYEPTGLRWSPDGVHPANGADMQAGAAQTVEAPAAAAPAATPQNPLTPPAPAPVQATFRPAYGNVIPYDASRFIGATGVTQQQYDLWRSYLAQRESAGYGQPPNGDRHSPIALEGQTVRGYMGRYQMGSEEITDAAHALNIPVPSQQQFLGNPNLQEQLFEQYTLDHHNQMMSIPQYANGDARTRLSLLMGAHLGGVENLRKYVTGGDNAADSGGTTVGNYVTSAYHVLGGSGVPQLVASAPQPAPPQYVGAPAGSGFASGLPAGEDPGTAPYAAAPADSGMGTGLAADPNLNIARFADPSGYTDYNPLYGSPLRAGGAVGNVVQGQPQPTLTPGLDYPDPGNINEAGGPPGDPAGQSQSQSQPPGPMNAKQMFALGLAQGFRGVPVTYNPWASLERFPQDRGRPSNYVGGLTPASDPRIAVPGVSYSPVSNPFFRVIGGGGRAGGGQEIAAQQASYGGGG